MLNLRSFLDFLQASPSAESTAEFLQNFARKRGLVALDEKSAWNLEAGTSYSVQRGNCLSFFRLAEDYQKKLETRIVCSHLDSPCLKLKPKVNSNGDSLQSLGVGIYGSPILNTWLDRDLSLAGSVVFQNNLKQIQQKVIDFKKPIARIPNLSIHLHQDRTPQALDKQKEIAPIFLSSTSGKGFSEHMLELLNKDYKVGAEKIYSYNLSFYDVEPPSLLGIYDEFLASQRLDNLVSVFSSLESFLSAPSDQSCFFVVYDNEEVGSLSPNGANGSFLESILQRIYKDYESYARMTQKSYALSVDNAHAVHPHFPEKFDSDHKVFINSGPALKYQPSLRYAQDSYLFSLLEREMENAKIPLQKYAVHNVFPGGGTLGPFVAARLGLRTIDIGIGTWAMHSIRETCGVKDLQHLTRTIDLFYKLKE